MIEQVKKTAIVARLIGLLPNTSDILAQSRADGALARMHATATTEYAETECKSLVIFELGVKTTAAWKPPRNNGVNDQDCQKLRLTANRRRRCSHSHLKPLCCCDECSDEWTGQYDFEQRPDLQQGRSFALQFVSLDSPYHSLTRSASLVD